MSALCQKQTFIHDITKLEGSFICVDNMKEIVCDKELVPISDLHSAVSLFNMELIENVHSK